MISKGNYLPNVDCDLYLHSDVTLKLPYEINRSPDELFFTYLDTTGRPVIMLQKDNLVEMHIQDFEVSSVSEDIFVIIHR